MAADLFTKVNREYNSTDIDKGIGLPVIPEAIRLFLGKLSLLKGVPMYNLVPDEKYIPKTIVYDENNKTAIPVEMGSFRFFMLDKEWIECLLDGALSIGDPDDSQLLLSKAMAGNYAAEVFYRDTKEKIKQKLYGSYSPEEHADKLAEELSNKNIVTEIVNDKEIPLPTIAQNNWRYTGFFLRSSILSSWKGTEVIANGTDEMNITDEKMIRGLQVIRFERVAPDTLFCLCEGFIREVIITQPTETFHFAVNEPKLYEYDVIKEKMSGIQKILDKGLNNLPDETSIVKVPFRNTPGVINIENLRTSLGVNDSALFAAIMRSKPLKMTIRIDWLKETKTDKQ